MNYVEEFFWNLTNSYLEAPKKRLMRYVLEKYLGSYFTEKFSIDQLELEISNGTGSVQDLEIDCEALNLETEDLNLPFKFVDGCIGHLSIYIPWRNFKKQNCLIEIKDLQLTI